MRVLMVNKYYRVVGGVERYVSELTRLLERKGHEVIPFSMADPRNEPSSYAEYFVSGMDFFGEGQRPSPWAIAERVVYSREARRKIAALIAEVQPDLAHVHNIYHYISPSIFDALAAADVPVVMTLHDYKLICPVYSLWVDGEICERCRGGAYYHCALQRCNHGSLSASLLNSLEGYVHRLLGIYDKVDLFISPSDFLRRKHIQHGLEAERLAFVRNFVIAGDYVPRFDHDGYFAYMGRLTPFKGVGTLLRAMARLRPGVPLWIIGDGPARSDLEGLAGELGLGEDVRFLGYQSGERLRDLIRGSMFMVVPSEWYENCPYAVLEAFALGKPVVGAAVGGIPELVDDRVNGLLFEMGAVEDLAEKLSSMLALPSPSLGELGEAARLKVERMYDEESHYRALSILYHRLSGP